MKHQRGEVPGKPWERATSARTPSFLRSSEESRTSCWFYNTARHCKLLHWQDGRAQHEASPLQPHCYAEDTSSRPSLLLADPERPESTGFTGTSSCLGCGRDSRHSNHSSLSANTVSSQQPARLMIVLFVKQDSRVQGEGAAFGQILALATLAVRIRNPIGVID
ncbi:hypothetical protein P7K49_017110 [Saguinus oedipus]|uniref:Uncharacterized protein n=1 Tax=Saguinus oedipus TaxID=9490 RepID=A0ABQ9V2M9_SAGOE|nr:hypothetical protein P7K49_017110 [Saguinus oedipus]